MEQPIQVYDGSGSEMPPEPCSRCNNTLKYVSVSGLDAPCPDCVTIHRPMLQGEHIKVHPSDSLTIWTEFHVTKPSVGTLNDLGNLEEGDIFRLKDYVHYWIFEDVDTTNKNFPGILILTAKEWYEYE
jgi:hypothetical protein